MSDGGVVSGLPDSVPCARAVRLAPNRLARLRNAVACASQLSSAATLARRRATLKPGRSAAVSTVPLHSTLHRSRRRALQKSLAVSIFPTTQARFLPCVLKLRMTALSDYSTPWTLAVGFIVIFICFFAMVEFREMARVTLFGSSNKAGTAFDPARDIPSLAGNVVLITGAAGDLGRQTAMMLARHGRPARIYVADLPRDEAAKKAVVDRITQEAYSESSTPESDTTTPRTEVRFLDLDLTSFESVRACAADFVAKEDRLDILFLNAGIIRVATGTTKEGFEVHFGLNYLGHALLSRLLVPTMLRTAQQQSGADVRVVVVSSEGHAMAPKGGVQFDKLRTNCADMVRYPMST